MKKYVTLAFFTMMIGSRGSIQEATENKFVQPKKKCNRISLDKIKRDNVERCSCAFESSASLVEGLGRFQKLLQHCFEDVIGKNSRTYHIQTEQPLEQITDLLHQMEDLLTTCEQCLNRTV